MGQDIIAEVEWDKLPTRRELAGQLDRLAMSADAKVLMAQLLATTAAVGGRIVEIGRGIMTFIINLVRRFPNTALGAVVGLTVTVLLGSIPLLGLVLGPLIGPILAAFTITAGALSDMKNSSIELQIAAFSAKLDKALARA